MSRYITIKGFAQMAPQQVLEMSVRHVAANGKPSVNESGQCVYSGIGCAAAPFIQPAKRAGAEFKNWTGLASQHRIPYIHALLVGRLQDAHDTAYHNTRPSGEYFLPEFFTRAREVALDYRLDGSFIDELEKNIGGRA